MSRDVFGQRPRGFRLWERNGWRNAGGERHGRRLAGSTWKVKAGNSTFKEVAKHGPIPQGHAVLTSAGRLPFKGIIHVAGINVFWFATDASIRKSVRSAMQIVDRHDFTSVAFPLIGSGSGNRSRKNVRDLMLDEFAGIHSSARVVIVEYKPKARPSDR